MLFLRRNYATIILRRPGLDSFPPGFIVHKEVIITTIAYVDGQNFLHRSAKQLTDAAIIRQDQTITAIDIPYLLDAIFPGEKIEMRYYGTAKIRKQTEFGRSIEKKSIQFADNLRQLKNYLKKVGVEYCAAGSLKVRDTDICKKCKRSSYKLQEKGVDVGLAVDLVSDALMKRVDHIILVSSDTDLIPAIKSARQNKKVRITFVGFSAQPVKAISLCSDETQMIRNEELIEAYNRANPQPELPIKSRKAN